MTKQDDEKYREKRRFQRAKFSTAVSVFHRSKFGLEKAVEISEGGMLLSVGQEYQIGEIFEVTFFLAGTSNQSVFAEVLYSFQSNGETLIGVRFLDSSPNLETLRNDIRDYIENAPAKS